MKSLHRTCLGLLSIAVLMLCSCGGFSRHVAYDEAAFIPYGSSGSGIISGHAGGIFRDGKARVANHSAVNLMPDNAYTEEIEKVEFATGASLQPPDSRFAKYVRTVTSDGEGNFTFRGVPPGNYYVTCNFIWSAPVVFYDPDGSFTESVADANQWLFAKVSIKNGGTVKVGAWRYGL